VFRTAIEAEILFAARVMQVRFLKRLSGKTPLEQSSSGKKIEAESAVPIPVYFYIILIVHKYRQSAKERCLLKRNTVPDETGVKYYGARYLDQKYSRWLSGDPALGDYIPTRGADASKLAGLGGVYNTVNLHLYHYSGNNPVKYIDPDGKVVFVSAAIVWGVNTILLSYGIGASRKDEYGFALRHPIISADRCKWVSTLRKIMKKQFILLLILIALFLFVCFFGLFYLPTTSKSKTTCNMDRKRKKTYRYL